MKLCIILFILLSAYDLVIQVTGGRLKRQLQVYREFDIEKREEGDGSVFDADSDYFSKRGASDDSDLKEITVKSNFAVESSITNNGVASKAIDGDCKMYSHSETRSENKPVWYIDMQNEYLVAKVTIGLQENSGASNFRNAILKALLDSPNMNSRTSEKMCGHFRGPGRPRGKVDIYCGSRGKYIVVILDASTKLEMCQMKIYTDPDESKEAKIEVNPQLAKQLGTDYGREASRAITGDCGTASHSETNWGKWPMWFIDLEKDYRVTKVIIGTRKNKKANRFHDVIIRMHDEMPNLHESSRSIYNDGCGFYDGPASYGDVITLFCGQAGRYFSVKVDSSSFYSGVEMCAMQIFGIDKSAPSTPAADTGPGDGGSPGGDSGSAGNTGPPGDSNPDGDSAIAPTGASADSGEDEPEPGDDMPPASQETAPAEEDVEAMSEGNQLLKINWINLMLSLLVTTKFGL